MPVMLPTFSCCASPGNTVTAIITSTGAIFLAKLLIMIPPPSGLRNTSEAFSSYFVVQSGVTDSSEPPCVLEY